MAMAFIKEAKCGPHTIEVWDDGDDLVIYTSGNVRFPEIWKTHHRARLTQSENIGMAFDRAVSANKLTFPLEYADFS